MKQGKQNEGIDASKKKVLSVQNTGEAISSVILADCRQIGIVLRGEN